MSLKSPTKDYFLTRIEALQQNLEDLIRISKTNQNLKFAPESNIDDLKNELFFIVDHSGNILNCNNAALEFLQFTSDELLELNLVDVVPIHQKKSFRDFFYNLKLDFPSHSFPVSFITKENQLINLSCKAVMKQERAYVLCNLLNQNGTEHEPQSAIDLNHKSTKEAYRLLIGHENLLPTNGKDGADSLRSVVKNRTPVFEEKKNSLSRLLGINSNKLAIMSTVDVNGFIVEVNEYWLELLGYNKEEVLGKEVLQFFHDNSKPYIKDEFIPEIASSGNTKAEKCLMVGKDGNVLEVSISGLLEYSSIQRIYKWFVFLDEPAKAQKVAEYNNDTTITTSSSEENSVSSVHHLKAIINSSKQILFLLDQKMDIIAFNKHAEKITALHTQKRIRIGGNILDFLSEDDGNGLREIYGEVLAGRSVHFTREMIFQDNARRWFEVNLFPVEDEVIHVRNVVFSAEDITERKQAEEKYKELEINFKSIFSQVAVGVMLYDLNHEIIQANKRFYELIEYSKEEFDEIQPMGITHPEDREKALKKTEELVSGKIDNYSQEKRYVTKSGRIVWVFLTATVVKNRQGKPKHIISVTQDISLRKTAEQELIYKKSELDTFVYRASHDLRGPVASLMGLYNIVKVEFAHDKNAITYFEHYNNSVMRLHAVLQNLIDLTKIKESETKITQVDLKELIDSCLNSMKNLSDFNRIAFDISVDIDFQVFIDAKKFKTIIKNLIENSIIYCTPESTAFVKVCVTYQENVLKVEVTDNGRGIDPRIQSKVFNMFFRGTEKSKGSGLGLYIVKNAVEKLNGSIQLSSKLNEGTKFSVYIPYLYGQEYSALLEKNFVN